MKGAWKHTRAGLAAVSLMALALTGTANAAPAAAERAASQLGARSVGFEGALAREVNAIRRRHGLSDLRPVGGLREAADAHSVAMLQYGFFAHDSIDGTSFADRIRSYFFPTSGAWQVGENLAMFGPNQLSARRVVTLWMNSPPHRRNLLAPGWHGLGISARFASRAGGRFGGAPTWVVTLDLGVR